VIPPAHIPPRPQQRRRYTCYLAPEHPTGKANPESPPWKDAPWTDDFVDIEGDAKPRPPLRTRVKLLWDSECLYILACMQEPHLWATLTEHDSVVYHDNDFEVFLSPTGDNHRYYELEVNALGTVFDLFLPKPYRDGGPADHAFHFEGLRKSVRLGGTLNDPRDTDQDWTVELAIPWTSLSRHGNASAPNDGDVWRLNFSRVQWDLEVIDGAYRKTPHAPEHNWVWSPQGLIDMHRPEMWGYLQFSPLPPGRALAAPRVDHALPAKNALHDIYYAQKAYHAATGAWASSTLQLNFPNATHPDLVGPPRLQPTSDGWQAFQQIKAEDGRLQTWGIRHDSLISRFDEPKDVLPMRTNP